VRDFYTVVFNGTVESLKKNPLFVQSPFGVPEHVTNGDVITEVEELLDVRRELMAALKECRTALNDIPISAYGSVNVDRCTAIADMALAKARNV
jgi:hypothetical protein